VSAPDRDEIRREILAHLAAHPECEDTLEGIAEWWLLERAIERRLREVEAALDGLVAEGLLERRGGAGGGSRYRLPDERRREVRRLLAEEAPAGPGEGGRAAGAPQRERRERESPQRTDPEREGR
jgi:hypothetical protein